MSQIKIPAPTVWDYDSMIAKRSICSHRRTTLLLAAALTVFTVHAADASLPVRKVITGCVVNGVLISHDGYAIRVRHRRTHEELGLRRYEGMRIRIRGDLLPGDNYFIDGVPHVLGKCK